MHVAVQREHLDTLNELFTRSYYSAAGYVFESQPFVVAEDAALLDLLSSIRREDRRHAQLLAGVIDDLEAVPLAGAFPYWYRDLNYLSVPFLAGFVAAAIAEDVERYAAAVAALPADAVGAKATLTAIRRDKQSHAERLAPLADEARVREAAAAKAKIDARKAARAARLAKEKAAKEGAKKAAAKPVAKAAGPAAAAAGLDPNEPGISPKERARRTMLAKRGGGAPAPGAAAPAAAAPVAGLDPNEPGIPPKEKARRAMLLKRGGTAPAAAPAAAPAPAAGADLPDPDEPGIPPKEKARRAMLRKRAAAGGTPPPAAAAPAAVAAPAPTAAPAEELLDPDEPGIAPKEKARRQMLKKRAAAGGAAPTAAPAPAPVAAPPPEPPAPVEEDLDPDEPGLSPKEKARRTMLRKRRKA